MTIFKTHEFISGYCVDVLITTGFPSQKFTKQEEQKDQKNRIMTRGSIISDGGRGEFSRGSTQSVFSGLEGSFPR